MVRPVKSFADATPFKKVVLIAIAPFAFLAALFGLLLILVPITIYNGSVYIVCWIRFLLFGIPMPAKTPPRQNSD
jgi:hypothetical protein